MAERIVNGALFVFCLGYTILAMKINPGTLSSPKAGFIPQIAGWLGTVISGFLFLQAMLGKGDKKDVKLNGDFKSLLLITIVIIIYIFLFVPLGYILSSILLLFALLVIGGLRGDKKKYLLAVLISILTTLAFYLIFRVMLSIPLPRGILG